MKWCGLTTCSVTSSMNETCLLKVRKANMKLQTTQNETLSTADVNGGLTKRKAEAIGSQATGALAIGSMAAGALALGAAAIGALAIGRLVVGRLIVRQSRVHSLEIDELRVRRLRVGKLIVDDELVLPTKDDL